MKKYLYVFNYPPEDKELCALEFRTLFKDEFMSKYYLSNNPPPLLLFLPP